MRSAVDGFGPPRFIRVDPQNPWQHFRFFYNVSMPETKTVRLTETVKAAG
ncbi:MAG TPA: hypothetical protein VLW06_11620 [Terriglobales bacterium]|nr:hypothetical protein [Terriglobales bacterium]